MHFVHDLNQAGKGIASPGVYDHRSIAPGSLTAQLDKFGKQHDRKIIYAEII